MHRSWLASLPMAGRKSIGRFVLPACLDVSRMSRRGGLAKAQFAIGSGPVPGSLFCRIFCTEPVSTSAENALGRRHMVSARGVKRAGFYDCPGGGQVTVENGIAYIGHIHSPSGTSIVDVKDPKNPKQLAYFEMPPGTHSHKARVGNGLMVINHEVDPATETGEDTSKFKGGLGIFDVSNPAKPRKIHDWV